MRLRPGWCCPVWERIMISRRPSIFIYSRGGDKDFLREILAGIEEEGVFADVTEIGASREQADVQTLAALAAGDSMLGVGIGIEGVRLALQMKGLAADNPVLSYYMPTYDQCRRLGANSARLIKKQSLREE